jgi:hypothetical protein
MAPETISGAHPIRRTAMPKGQQRSNREKKKPKQPKKIAPVPTGMVTPAKPGGSVPGKNR